MPLRLFPHSCIGHMDCLCSTWIPSSIEKKRLKYSSFPKLHNTHVYVLFIYRYFRKKKHNVPGLPHRLSLQLCTQIWWRWRSRHPGWRPLAWRSPCLPWPRRPRRGSGPRGRRPGPRTSSWSIRRQTSSRRPIRVKIKMCSDRNVEVYVLTLLGIYDRQTDWPTKRPTNRLTTHGH